MRLRDEDARKGKATCEADGARQFFTVMMMIMMTRVTMMP
jgi:hypothetical protein